jgi:spermidine synthase
MIRFLICLAVVSFVHGERIYLNGPIAMDHEIARQSTDRGDLAIFEDPLFGRVLSLDGKVKLTESDEAIYHEMMVHVPLLTHKNPISILILGGGTGGLLREVLKHPTVQQVVLVESETTLMDLSKTHLPKLSNGAFQDTRVNTITGNQTEFVKHCTETFDVILSELSVDSADFYFHAKKRLNKGGIFVHQNSLPFLEKNTLAKTFEQQKSHFKHIAFYTLPTPTSLGGPLAIGFASNRKYTPSIKSLKQRLLSLNSPLFYYTPSIHRAAFALPSFISTQLETSP